MNYFKVILDRFKKESFTSNLITINLVLLVLLLLKLTDTIWVSILKKLISIFLPFIVGFIIAFALRPMIIKYEKKKISRKITITISFSLILIVLIALLLNLLPTVYSRLFDFINTIISSINYLLSLYNQSTDNQSSLFLDTLVNQVIVILNDTKNWLPNITTIIPQIFSFFTNFITNSIFVIIIGIYMSLGWEKIAEVIENISSRINERLPKYLYVSGYAVSEYIRALAILMVIKFIEYSILYYLIGHKDWMIISTLTSLGLLIPYFGATIANTIGILTALSLPFTNVAILVVAIVILSSVDAYLIAPLVHSKNSRVEPLWTLFCIFSGGVILGPIGVMISIPVYMCIRVILKVYKEENSNR